MNDKILNYAIKKGISLNSDLSYRVIAIGFTEKGELLGAKTNSFGIATRHGAGRHAERELIKRYKENIAKIVLLRVGRTGNLLPIKPCETCQKVIDKLGIKVETL